MKALQTIIAVATLLHAANTFAQTEEVVKQVKEDFG